MLEEKTSLPSFRSPSILQRVVEVSNDDPKYKFSFVLLGDVIAMHLDELFPGFSVVGSGAFRVTRNFHLDIDEDEAEDLLETIQKELRKRERGHAVRLEVSAQAPQELRTFLQHALDLEEDEVYDVNGPLHLADFMSVAGRDELREWRYPSFAPQKSPIFRRHPSIFRVIESQDILLHHPYESFDHVVDFVSEAADDPGVLAIKQTLYRTNANSPIVRALVRAAENGKQVTAVVELKARFDEGPNIAWARQLEEAGVHVVYGLVGYKTHCKASLVVRRQGDRIKRYVHLSTGNYNPSTARLYGDISIMTAREDFADDAGALFNLLTGYSYPPAWKRFAVAPNDLADKVLDLIAAEAKAGPKGRIIAKMNSLVDPKVIEALYKASQAGVEIDLLVRGICCLRPGIPGLSDNIKVTALIDRFLEHARIFYFEAQGRREIYLASADWMPRNFYKRIEILFPIDDPGLKNRLFDEILMTAMADTEKSWNLEPDGSYTRVTSPEDPKKKVRSQQDFIDLARRNAKQKKAKKTKKNDGAFSLRGAPSSFYSLSDPDAP